jgi:hypothetical protein
MEPKRSCIRRLGEAAGKKPKSSWRLLSLPRVARRVEAAGNGTQRSCIRCLGEAKNNVAVVRSK